MIFGITDQGFNRMLESDIGAAIIADAAPIFDVDPTTTDWPNTDSPLSQLIRPFARQAGLLWELAEAAIQGIDPDQAFGTMLDALLSINNITRLEAAPTEVLAAISGTQGSVVPAGTQVSVISSAALFAAKANATITSASLLRFNVQIASASSIGTPFATTINGHAVSSGSLGGAPTRDTIAMKMLAALNADTTVNPLIEAVFYGTAIISVITVANLTGYTVTLDGIAISYTSDASALSQEIVDNLVANINAGQDAIEAIGINSSSFSLGPRVAGSDWSMALSANLDVGGLTPIGAFAVKSKDLLTPFSGAVDARMAIDKLFSPQTYASVATGPIEAPAGTLTVIENHITGFTAVTNFLDGVLGSDVEADDPARVRREETVATGSAHTRAVLSALNKLKGVTLSRAYENITDLADADGRPGHSVEFLVQGGDADDIALTIWDGRAAGITPYGNINSDETLDPDGSGSGITVKDSNDADQIVHFSRPEPKYAYLTIVKTLYSEEDFPSAGDEAIRQAVLAYGATVGIGKDFLLQRFIGPCVSIPGVGGVDIRIAAGDDPDTPPVGYPSSGSPTGQDWRVNRAISPRQVLIFDSSRITVS